MACPPHKDLAQRDEHFHPLGIEPLAGGDIGKNGATVQMNSTTRHFEILGGVIADVAIDEDGFTSISLAHPACGTSMGYASGPLDTMSEDIECSDCGETLMRYTREDDVIMDASHR